MAVFFFYHKIVSPANMEPLYLTQIYIGTRDKYTEITKSLWPIFPNLWTFFSCHRCNFLIQNSELHVNLDLFEIYITLISYVIQTLILCFMPTPNEGRSHGPHFSGVSMWILYCGNPFFSQQIMIFHITCC